MNMKQTLKMVGAGLMAASLLAATACGSNKEGDKPAPAASSVAVSSTKAASTTEAVTSAQATTEQPSATKQESAAASKKPEESEAEAPQVLPAPAPMGTVEPAANGRPGTPEEEQAITAMLKRQESATTVNEYFSIFVDSMCTEIINEQGGPQAFSVEGLPDVPLNSIPEYEAMATKVTGVAGLRVDGQRATADVTTVTGAGESATNTMAFRNEQGNWKLCR